jgi:DNA-binding transcriptional ArsR family regulator
MEMIEDFLGTFGMKKPPRNIVSLMGAEYTEEFGQKKFTELSPRTLMRHLSAYEKDPRKRKQIVELSGGGMITKPDAELFYEFNIELMRSLYGEEYIQRLLKERLRSL